MSFCGARSPTTNIIRSPSRALRGCSAQTSLFWCVATRPITNNGLGFSPTGVLAEINKIEHFLTVLPESPLVYPEWKRLVLRHGITGVRVHDARLVAVMNVHKVRRVLTFDKNDFAAFGIEVIHPTLVCI